MAKLWMIVDHGISSGSGYSRRVLFELECMSTLMEEKPLLIYPNDCKISPEFLEISTPIAISARRPFVINRWTLEQQLNQLRNKYGPPLILYCQNLMATWAASRFAKKNNIHLVMDYHGAVPAEIRQGNPRWFAIIKGIVASELERQAVNAADTVVVVSNNHGKYLLKFGKHAESKLVTLPMIPSRSFFEETAQQRDIRAELGIDKSATVFCYLGQCQPWQMARETIEFFSRLEKQMPNVHLVILTLDTHIFTRMAHKAGLQHVTILTAPHKDVPIYLKACDYGFVFRNSSIINRVASPTKVLEYACCGVVPLMTPWVGDYYEELTSRKLGIGISMAQIKGDSELPVFRRPTENQKEQLRNYVIEYARHYLSVYKSCLGNILNR